MKTPSTSQEFVEALNLICSLTEERNIESVRASMGASEFDQALERAVATCRRFLASATNAGDGSGELPAILVALSSVEDGLAQHDDAKVISGVQLLRDGFSGK